MNYFDYQPFIATGDWIEVAGTSEFSQKIRQITGFDVNHSTLVIRNFNEDLTMNRRLVIEALGSGLEMNMLSDLVAENTFAYWYRLKPEYEHLRPQIWAVMNDEYSARRGNKKKYDLWDMLRNAWRRVRLDTSDWYCTEWCQWVYGQVGILTPAQCEIAMVPGEIEGFQKHLPKVKLTINKEVKS